MDRSSTPDVIVSRDGRGDEAILVHQLCAAAGRSYLADALVAFGCTAARAREILGRIDAAAAARRKK